MEENLMKRVLPHSIEAEQSVIGSMLMDRDAIIAASEIVTADEFYQHQYGVMFEAMVELFNEGKPVDLVTLQNRLKEKDVPPEVSSLEFVRDIITMVPTSANVRSYANIVREKAVLRKLIKINEEIANTCYVGKEKLEDILAMTEKSVFDLLQTRSGGDFVPIRQVALNVLEKIEVASRNQGAVTGIPTGFIDLDYKTSGMQPSDFILIAARPGMGKTSFAMNIATHVARHSDREVAVFSLEMSKEQIATRLLSTEALVDSNKLRSGFLTSDDWVRLATSAGVLSGLPMYIDDTAGITAQQIKAKLRRMKNVGLVVIDYLQLMTSTLRTDNRVLVISEITRQLKIMAKEMDVPVILLSQLSRAPEGRTDKRPMLSDLRESGSIEQDADIVLFLYRDAYYNKESPTPNISECIVAKNRHGNTGTVKMIWDGQFTRFSNMEMQHET